MSRRRSRSKWRREGETAAKEIANRPTSWIPVIAAESRVEDDRVVVSVPRFRNRLGRALVDRLGREQVYNLRLDEFGSFVWGQIDGRRNVVEIAEVLEEHYGEEIRPAVPRLLEFLQSLYNTRAITVTRHENPEVEFK